MSPPQRLSSSTFPGLYRIRKVPWRYIPENAIVLQGAEVNGYPLEELRRFPPVDAGLRETLLSRYRFLERHTVLVAEADSPLFAARLGESVRDLWERMVSLRSINGEFEERRGALLKGLSPRKEPGGADRFRSHPAITDQERLVNYLATSLRRLLNRSEVYGYLFSERARRVSLPIDSVGMRAAETMQGSLFKKVLENRSPTARNKLILITDGEPSDFNSSKAMAAKLKELRVDYTQVLLHHDDELREAVDRRFRTSGMRE